MGTLQQQLTLHKGREQFVFRYDRGQESHVLNRLIEYARDDRISLDLIDVTILILALRRSDAEIQLPTG